MRGKLPGGQAFRSGAGCAFNEARALCAGSWGGLRRGCGVHQPSMRPAHYAREVVAGNAAEALRKAPSMRPAHYAREVQPGAAILLAHRCLQ